MMKKIVLSALCATALLTAPQAWAQTATSDTQITPDADAAAQDADTPAADGLVTMPTEGVALADFLWDARVLVIFADNPRDPSFQRQLDLLAERPDTLEERDVVVLTDTDPAMATEVRTKLRPRGFTLVIVDKDGRVMLRKPSPWDIREISRAIDKTPLRQQEISEAKEAARAGG
ncbi:DUF4174 domain-containing protein [Celeribacter sp.]|uniref:DUF4174 domain-containing protein n=1 Tax=Celeribacter sp. TaxID=1890673 RepID=UPI003A8D3D70